MYRLASAAHYSRKASTQALSPAPRERDRPAAWKDRPFTHDAYEKPEATGPEIQST
ncbi:hypothetical protein CNECB9_2370112 [Cupriavidus necator]|uniref:Uncharacterized protein n=1 Tax=Cupriavidus necator TaxID=106590 RepID=A0A1K0J8X9_CUPNE|nr:hypothetical protein CNECB9_2370112 [Cupriavidus necator]